MSAKFTSNHQNILQPKRLNSPEVGRIQKGGQRIGGTSTGQTLTLNGVAIGIPTTAHSVTTIVNSMPPKKGGNNMAKRNARERNRVKQVNLGFHALRQHIPEGYRMKKMSKVDTLRCAVDYIRSMERILEIVPLEEDDRNNSSYLSFSSDDMNQQLDKICSLQNASSMENSTLEHPFSSFSSENDGSSGHDSSSSFENHHPNPPEMDLKTCVNFHHPNAEMEDLKPCIQFRHLLPSEDDCKGTSEMVAVTSQGNGGPFQNIINSSTAPSSILMPVQFNENGNMITGDENFSPSNPSFIRVVEIIQLQST